ncbi:MAG: hypothetical protein WA728_08080 [Xanthobacteraceae bacterium]
MSAPQPWPRSTPIIQKFHRPEAFYELNSDELREAFEEKFVIDLSGRPAITTVQGWCDAKDGEIHNDSTSKIITIYTLKSLPQSVCQDRNRDAQCDGEYRERNNTNDQRKAFGCGPLRGRRRTRFVWICTHGPISIEVARCNANETSRFNRKTASSKSTSAKPHHSRCASAFVASW